MTTYQFRTDVAHGEVEAKTVKAALAKLIEQGEWAQGAREERDIADGAWLTIFDAEGIPVLRRGTMA